MARRSHTPEAIAAGALAMLVALMVFGGPIAAQAATAQTSGASVQQVAATLPPSCVAVRHTSGIVSQTVYLTNNCATTVGVVVEVWAYAGSPCLRMRPRQSAKYTWPDAFRFDGAHRGHRGPVGHRPIRYRERRGCGAG